MPTVSLDQWKAAVQKDLKDVPFEKKLLFKTPEEIVIKPLYTADDLEKAPSARSWPGAAPYVRGRTAAGYVAKAWDVSQEMTFPSALEFNTAARNALDRGLTAFNVVLDQATRNGHDPDWAELAQVGAGGLSVATLDDLQKAFEGIDLQKISLFIRSGASGFPFAALLMAFLRKRGFPTHHLQGCIEIDPLGVLTHEGRLPVSLAGSYREMAELTRWAYTHAPKLQTICIHTRAWHESGGTAVQELAFAMATAVDYFRALHERGLPVDLVAPRVRLAVTVGSHFFMEIAKLRAFRLLWANLIQVLGGGENAQKISIHVRTSLWNKTRIDPWVNILRATTEAFSGVLGGCDSMQVGAYDEPWSGGGDAARRLARNTQLVLQHECDLTHVIDPVGGSWFVESLTQELAEKAWALLQDVEKKGGMAKCLETGFIQNDIERVSRQKKNDVAHRRTVLVGTTHYPNAGETPVVSSPQSLEGFQKRRAGQIASYRTQDEEEKSTKILECLARLVASKDEALFETAVDAAALGATLGEISRSLRIKDGVLPSVAPVKISRLAETFESIRLGQSTKPFVHLLAVGGLSAVKPRADFSKAYFEAAGFYVSDAVFSATLEAALKNFPKAQPQVVVLCAPDDQYPLLVPEAIKALRAVLPSVVIVLAGYPSDHLDAFRKAGVDAFIHIKSNWVETVESIQSRLGGRP